MMVNNAINVYGDCGAGKTRLVEEAAKYLGYRYLYTEGIYKIDLKCISSNEQINQIINNLKMRKDHK